MTEASIDPDMEYCDRCGDPVEPSYSYYPTVPLCKTCWIEEQKGE